MEEIKAWFENLAAVNDLKDTKKKTVEYWAAAMPGWWWETVETVRAGLHGDG
ncbi:MAG: hypothetical protein ACLSAC_17515 [Enterocloster bolteae]